MLSTVGAFGVVHALARPSEGRTPEAEPRMDASFGVSGKGMDDSEGGVTSTPV
ncbi:MAG: hypothetical protein IMF06_04120 [Proteobacteria bacterium]|nr:hypothetical protein [Pseudomonadota bacterium]